MKTISTLLVLMLFSCGNKLKEGRIINKFYEPSKYYTFSEYNPSLKTVVMRNVYDDEDYVFIVSNIIENDTITERFEVSYTTYNSFSIGNWIKFDN
jgi:hypothetical protein